MSHVKDFGARGDGRTDDTDAIEHAVQQGDGLLLFSRGEYRVTRTIVVDLERTGRFAVSGDGGLATVRMDGPGPAFFVRGTHGGTADPKGFRSEVWERERMPTFNQIEIVGAHEEACGIRFEGVMQATLEGVLIRKCRIGVHLTKRNRNFLMSHCHVYDGAGAAIGVYLEGVNLHQANIVGSHISYHRHAGIKVEGSEIRNLQITGCDVEYNFDSEGADCADIWVDTRKGTVREGTIASCTVQAKRSPGGANIRIEGPDLPLSTAGGLWTISGNVIQSQDINLLLRSVRAVNVTGNSFCSGFQRSVVVDRCRNIAMSGNTIDYNPDYSGERVDGMVVEGSSGVVVSGWIFESVRAGEEAGCGALTVRASDAVTISGCQFFDSAGAAVQLAGVRDSLVMGNIFGRRKGGELPEAWVRSVDGGAGVRVSGNLKMGNEGTMLVSRGGLAPEE
jgi:hypothetical protein